MFIAFEGPDNTGKSTSAANLAWDGEARYNVTKGQHAVLTEKHREEPELVVAYDRIDWLTHMVYRLALPERDWNDDRPRTVFAMPDTHLVVKIHHPQFAELIEDELYSSGTVARVNPMYYYFADFFMALNKQQGYALFRSVSIVEVLNNHADGTFVQTLKEFDADGFDWGTQYQKLVQDDESLLEMLRYVDQHTL